MTLSKPFRNPSRSSGESLGAKMDNDETFLRSQDALLETFLLLMKASNRTTDKAEFLKLKRKREEVSRELDRIELAQINEAIPPAEVQAALKQLKALTTSLVKERERIQKVTENLDKIDGYLATATDVLKLVGKVLTFL
jgi:uncharacterized coiled-coil DUF342 family protein